MFPGILHLLANDCYRTGQFFVAAKAFDVLDKYDPSPEHAAAKRGACVGLFQMILAGREHRYTAINLTWRKLPLYELDFLGKRSLTLFIC